MATKVFLKVLTICLVVAALKFDIIEAVSSLTKSCNPSPCPLGGKCNLKLGVPTCTCPHGYENPVTGDQFCQIEVSNFTSKLPNLSGTQPTDHEVTFPSCFVNPPVMVEATVKLKNTSVVIATVQLISRAKVKLSLREKNAGAIPWPMGLVGTITITTKFNTGRNFSACWNVDMVSRDICSFSILVPFNSYYLRSCSDASQFYSGNPYFSEVTLSVRVNNETIIATDTLCSYDTSPPRQIILKRTAGDIFNDVNFRRYEYGFKSDAKTGYWIGLFHLYQATKGSNKYKLRVQFTESTGKVYCSEYKEFKVDGPEDYKLTVKDYRNCGAPTLKSKFMENFDGFAFSTKNRGPNRECGKLENGWWFKKTDECKKSDSTFISPLIKTFQSVTWDGLLLTSVDMSIIK